MQLAAPLLPAGDIMSLKKPRPTLIGPLIAALLFPLQVSSTSLQHLSKSAGDASSSMPASPTSTSTPLRNDLTGSLSGQVDFAQTHVVGATRRIFDPLLIPEREALVLFSPMASLSGVSLIVELNGKRHEFDMEPPARLPGAARFDVENTFSGKIIEGEYSPYRTNTFSYRLPWNLFAPGAKLTFAEKKGVRQGSLQADKLTFLEPESEGLVLMNIKACIFKDARQCDVTVDQFDAEDHPLASQIAARELFSILPVKRFRLGLGKLYWPRIVALGSDGKPHVYDSGNGKEWAESGEERTLPAKLGAGHFWRSASNLGNKAVGRHVAITGTLLDAPDGMPVLPPGVGASCGGNNCNYPNRPAGFLHETGHGLGLPHDTPGRYEDWAYRSYDNRLLPNTHPDPKRDGLPVDHLGNHYFGHVVGSSSAPSWATGTASAPLIDDFESLRIWNGKEAAAWRNYIAPFSHQQTLRVQQRFGSIPQGIVYADLRDDHRARLRASSRNSVGSGSDEFASIDSLADAGSGAPFMTSAPSSSDEPIATGVPVHTIVATFSDPSHNNDGVNQIYPAIITNYGNVFSPREPDPFHPMTYPQTTAHDGIEELLVDKNGQCLVRLGPTVAPGDCKHDQAKWRIQPIPPVEDAELGPLVRLIAADGSCLNYGLKLVGCDDPPMSIRWNGRRDLSGSDSLLRLQEAMTGRFITPSGSDAYQLHGLEGDIQDFRRVSASPPIPFHQYIMEIEYKDGAKERHGLYSGILLKDDLRTIAVNVSSERLPSKAKLLVDGKVVFERAMEANELPAAINVGAEFGYPKMSETWPLGWIRSSDTQRCLASETNRLAQRTCSADTLWRFAPRQPISPEKSSLFALQGWDGRCVMDDLSMNACSDTVRTTWNGREDLTGGNGLIHLQEWTEGKFVTAFGDSSIAKTGYTGELNQVYEQLSYLSAVHGHWLQSKKDGRCLGLVKGRLKLLQCGRFDQRWQELPTESLTGEPPGVALMINPDQRCLNSSLEAADCSGINDPAIRWSTRPDMANASTKLFLQEMKSGRFISVESGDALNLNPFEGGDSQIFERLSLSDLARPIRLRSTLTGLCLKSGGTLSETHCSGDETVWHQMPVDRQQSDRFALIAKEGEACLRQNLLMSPCGDTRDFHWRGRVDLTGSESRILLQESATGRFITVGPGKLPSLEALSDSSKQSFDVVPASK
jgi:hypothetical protein